MIISASRRTDIPAFYAPWLLERVREGWCDVYNPRNIKQIKRVSLLPGDVDAWVFWTRAPAALARLLPALTREGHARSVALVTLTGEGRELEPRAIDPQKFFADMAALSAWYGDPYRVVWRYDPIVLGPHITADAHRRRFATFARELAGSTRRVVISFLDLYRKTRRRLADYPVAAELESAEGLARAPIRELVRDLVAIAGENGMELRICAEPVDYAELGALPASCIDGDWLSRLFPEREFPRRKDPGQRRECRCALSVDIGQNDTCPAGCVYCYAVRSPEKVAENRRRHDPKGSFLLPPPRRGPSL